MKIYIFFMRNVLAIVPARGGSKGVPRKNLKKINELTLVEHAVICCKSASPWIDVVVSSDSKETIDLAVKSGAIVNSLRPEHLSGDRVEDTPVLLHECALAEQILGKSYDIVMMIQPTCPLRKPEDLNEALSILISNANYTAVWSVTPVDISFHPMKQLVCTDSTCLSYFNEKGKNIVARQELSTTFIRNGAVYAIRRSALSSLKDLKSVPTFPLQIHRQLINIDTLDDLELARELMRNTA